MYKIYICYDLDVVFNPSASIRSLYRTFITTTNASVTSFRCSGNADTKLPEQQNDVTGVLVVVMNVRYDERMHADGLKTTSRS